MNMCERLRSWDASIQAWRIGWTNPIRGHREEQIGTGTDGTSCRTARARRHEDALVVHEITGDSFHWRGEALYPHGMSWTLEGEFLATRRRMRTTLTGPATGALPHE